MRCQVEVAMPPKPLLEVVAERLDNHIEADDKAWEENKEMLKEVIGKLTIACDWITEQKVKISMSKYIAGGIGGIAAGIFLLALDKLWP